MEIEDNREKIIEEIKLNALKEKIECKVIQCPKCEMEFHSYDEDFEGIPEHICLNNKEYSN